MLEIRAVDAAIAMTRSRLVSRPAAPTGLALLRPRRDACCSRHRNLGWPDDALAKLVAWPHNRRDVSLRLCRVLLVGHRLVKIRIEDVPLRAWAASRSEA